MSQAGRVGGTTPPPLPQQAGSTPPPATSDRVQIGGGQINNPQQPTLAFYRREQLQSEQGLPENQRTDIQTWTFKNGAELEVKQGPQGQSQKIHLPSRQENAQSFLPMAVDIEGQTITPGANVKVHVAGQPEISTQVNEHGGIVLQSPQGTLLMIDRGTLNFGASTSMGPHPDQRLYQQNRADGVVHIDYKNASDIAGKAMDMVNGMPAPPMRRWTTVALDRNPDGAITGQYGVQHEVSGELPGWSKYLGKWGQKKAVEWNVPKPMQGPATGAAQPNGTIAVSEGDYSGRAIHSLKGMQMNTAAYTPWHDSVPTFACYPQLFSSLAAVAGVAPAAAAHTATQAASTSAPPPPMS
jgi:hypothetical protein